VEKRRYVFCDELRFDLQKANLEILSYEQVIKLLQEEVRNKQLCIQPDPMEQKDV